MRCSGCSSSRGPAATATSLITSLNLVSRFLTAITGESYVHAFSTVTLNIKVTLQQKSPEATSLPTL